MFIPVGVGQPGGDLRPLARVPEDLARMTGLFEARGYDPVSLPSDLDATSLRAALGGWLDEAALGPADAAVLYYSGHGCVVDGEHYLCPRGFSAARAATTGVKAHELVELVVRRQPRAGKVWIILDCCSAGGALDAAIARALHAASAEVFVLGAADAWSPAFDGSFSAAFVAGAEAETGPDHRGPSLGALAAAVNARRPRARAVAAAVSWSRFDLLDRANASP